MYDATNQAPAHLVPLRNADGIFVATTYTAIFKALPSTIRWSTTRSIGTAT